MQNSEPDPESPSLGEELSQDEASAIVCPVCGGATVQEKCKVVCRSDLCRGRVVMNCAEF